MTNLAVLDARLTRVEEDVKEIKADIKDLRTEIKELRAEMLAGFKELRDVLAKQAADIAYVKGRLETLPTTLQLGGFVIAIFVATGLTRYFVH